MIKATIGTPCNMTLLTSLFLILDALLLLEEAELLVLLLLLLLLLPPLDAIDEDELDDCECKYD